MWSTHRIILSPKILIFVHSLKINFSIIGLLWPRPAHSFRCKFANTMARQEPVGDICWPYNSGSRDEDGPEFIRCVEGRESQIHEVWDFGEDGVMCVVHPTAWIDVGAVLVDVFVTDYLTPSWRRVYMFGENSINGSVQSLGVPHFLRTYGPPWTDSILAPSLFGEMVVLPTIWTVKFNLVNPMAVLPSCGVVISVPCRLTSAGFCKTFAALGSASMTISFNRIVRRKCKISPLPAATYAIA